VSDDPPASLVDNMSRTFRETDGDIRAVLRTMFSSDEFWSREAVAAKVKTPFEFVVSAARASGAEVSELPPGLVLALRELGQPLYAAQPPTGYKDTADAWVSTGALLARMKVALGLASNCTGTVNDVKHFAGQARQAGALVYVDAVQYAPHYGIDVQRLGADILVSSAYKWFGPHQGILWGREALLRETFGYKVRPAGEGLPHKFETGTLSHEGMAGCLGAIEYLEQFGEGASRKARIAGAWERIAAYEQKLTLKLIEYTTPSMNEWKPIPASGTMVEATATPQRNWDSSTRPSWGRAPRRRRSISLSTLAKPARTAGTARTSRGQVMTGGDSWGAAWAGAACCAPTCASGSPPPRYSPPNVRKTARNM